jgi:ankyrin repeat protein
MGSKMKIQAFGCLVSLVSVAAVAMASDLRLVEATVKGDRDAVRSLLKASIDVNASQPDGATAIAWAAQRDDLETADLLIAAGADVNAANDYGITPLWQACSDGSSAMVEKLLKAGAGANAASWSGQSALMACARTGKLEAVKALLAREARINQKERQGHTALMWAVAGKHSEVARVLVEHGADVHARSEGGFTPLMFAAQQGHLETAKMLLAAGADVNEATPDGDTPLLVASASGHEAFAIFLLDQGANPNAADRNGITALHYSIMKGLAEVVGIIIRAAYVPYTRRPDMMGLAKALLAHGANPNARLTSQTVENDTGPGYGKIHRIDHLNAGGGRIMPRGATPLVLAGRNSNAEIMRALAAAGADPHLVTDENVSPLMTAAGIGRGRGRPPLTEEEETQALEAVKVAVEVLGNNVNAAETTTGLTALHGAAFAGSDRIIQYLVEKGANMDAKDFSGQTPLHKASNIAPEGFTERNFFPYAYRKSTVELLLKLGATPVEGSLAQGSDTGAATPKAPAANQ